MEIKHMFGYDASNPVLVYSEELVEGKDFKAVGVVNYKGHKLQEKDILNLPQLNQRTPSGDFEVKKIIKRFTPAGKFTVDITDCGFEAIKTSIKEEK